MGQRRRQRPQRRAAGRRGGRQSGACADPRRGHLARHLAAVPRDRVPSGRRRPLHRTGRRCRPARRSRALVAPGRPAMAPDPTAPGLPPWTTRLRRPNPARATRRLSPIRNRRRRWRRPGHRTWPAAEQAPPGDAAPDAPTAKAPDTPTLRDTQEGGRTIDAKPLNASDTPARHRPAAGSRGPGWRR